MLSSILAALLVTQDNDRPKKPRSKREQKAREIGYKIGRPLGIITGIAFAIAMIVLICS